MPHDRIDVHQHIIPPRWREALESTGTTSGGWPTPDWSPASAVDMMDRQGIATGVLSVTSPGTSFDGIDDPRGLARAVNDFGAELAKDRPDRFGTFASLPLPDADGAVEEAVYALDVLGSDGVVLMSNAGGKYLGDPDYEQLWQELDARGAVVFIHPAQPPMPLLDGTPAPMVDYVFDTTRAALNMVLAGVMNRYTDMRVILAHGGGFLPYAAYRFASLTATTVDTGCTEDSVLTAMRRFYFDTALASSPSSLPSLLEFAAPGHVLYGSDWPFANEKAGTYFNSFLETYDGFTTGQQHEVNRGAAEVLFPRLVP